MKRKIGWLVVILVSLLISPPLAVLARSSTYVTGSVSGLVLDFDLKPVAGVRVLAYRPEVHWEVLGDGLSHEIVQWIDPGYTGQTGRNGAYRFDLPAGTYRLWFLPEAEDLSRLAREAYPDAPAVVLGQSLTITRGKTLAKVNAVLDPGGALIGHITDSDGLPLSGIPVLLGIQQTGFVDFGTAEVMTDSHGDYRINGLKPYGFWEVGANLGPLAQAGFTYGWVSMNGQRIPDPRTESRIDFTLDAY